MSGDVRLDVPLPAEILEIARQKRKDLLGSDGKVDREKVLGFVKGLDKGSLRGIYEQYEELRRRRLEERSRYYEPLSMAVDGSPQLEFHRCEKKIVVASGGNQSGKTEAGIQEINWCCTGTHPYKRTWDPPIYCRINSVSWKDGHGKIIIPKLKEVVRREDLKGGSWETGFNDSLSSVGGSMTLTFKNGSFVELMTYDQDPEKHGGVQRHLILCDEEPPKPIYDESLPRLSRYDGRMLITMTPVNGITWTFDDLYDTDNPNVQVFFFPTLSNKHLPQQSRDFMEQMYANDPEEALIRLDGVPAERGGLVIRGFKEELHVVDDFPIPSSWPRSMAIDPAPAKSHAAVFAAVDPRTLHNPSGKMKVYFYKELLFPEGAAISAFCKELVEVNDGDYVKHFRIDPHWDWENKATRTEQRQGFNIFKEFKSHIPNLKPALANEESQKGGWIYYEAMKERLIVDLMAKDLNAKVGVAFFRHGCRQTIKQVKKLSYVKPRDPNAVRSKPQIRHKDDDLVDCAGMILVDKVITELRTSEPLSRQTEPQHRRCPVTGRILD